MFLASEKSVASVHSLGAFGNTSVKRNLGDESRRGQHPFYKKIVLWGLRCPLSLKCVVSSLIESFALGVDFAEYSRGKFLVFKAACVLPTLVLAN